MTGQVEHFERTVAGVDDIAFDHLASDPSGLLAVLLEHVAGWQRVHEVRRFQLVTRRRQHCHRFLAPPLHHVESVQCTGFQQRRFERVRDHVGKLMMRPDVIVVAVRRNCGHRLVEQRTHFLDQAAHTHPRVDHQVAVATTHMPDIAPHQCDDVRLPQQRDGVVDRATFEPTISNRQHHRRTHDLTLDGCQPCRLLSSHF